MIFKRQAQVDEPAPTIFIDSAWGSVSGGQLDVDRPAGFGESGAGRGPSRANLTAARRFFVESDPSDFEVLDSGLEVCDKASGKIYRVLVDDPLFATGSS